MKKYSIFTILFLMLKLNTLAQNKEDNITEDFSYYSVTGGINLISNDLHSPLDFEKSQLSAQFFGSIERKFRNNLSLSLNLSSNKMRPSNSKLGLRTYLSSDIFVNYFFDDLILKNNTKTDLYAGLGTGLEQIGGLIQSSFNYDIGIRYWVKENLALSIQAVSKLNKNGITGLSDHYQYNLGISYKFGRYKKGGYLDPKTSSTTPNDIEPLELKSNLSTDKAVEDSEFVDADENSDSAIIVEKQDKSIEEEGDDTEMKETSSADSMVAGNESSLFLKNQATSIDNTTSLNGFHVIIYHTYEIDQKLINILQVLTRVPLRVFKDPAGSFTYISIAQFETKEEAINYINNSSLDKKMFDYIGVFEVNN